ncbi:MAG TPA: hypothetical protein EYM49_02625, partial [Campylobacterales bacterium]|nr:hypothetical protein [Campylobacterales bacterium]
MFSFFGLNSKKLLSSVDLHSHLIPGIDDGAKDLETSLLLIKELKALGYKKLITTPHISDMFPNSSRTILEGYRILKEELSKQNIQIELEIGAEYYADEQFEILLESNDILSFGKERYLLFELSYFTPPQDIDNLIYDIKLKGYTPVLAHPERYLYWHLDFNKYRELKEMGTLFQINLNSTVGYYNKDIQHIAE